MNEAGSLRQEDVIAALDHARIAEGPGGPGGNGSRPARRPHEHVHRPGEERPFRIVEILGHRPGRVDGAVCAEFGQGPIA